MRETQDFTFKFKAPRTVYVRSNATTKWKARRLAKAGLRLMDTPTENLLVGLSVFDDE